MEMSNIQHIGTKPLETELLKGIMSEACNRVIEFAFRDVGFHKIYSWYHSDNPASGRVMQKCGMKFTKTEYRKMDNERLSGEYHYYEI